VRYLLAIIGASAIVAAVVAQNAGAWHAADATAVTRCDTTRGLYDVTATVTQSGQWPGAFVRSVNPSTIPGGTTGPVTITIVVAWTTTTETQTFKRTLTLDGKCGVICEPVIKEVVREVPVDRVVYVDRVVKDVQIQYVDRVVEKVVEKPVTVTKTVYVVRYKTRWKTRTVVKHVFHTKVIHDRCPPPKVCCEGKG
jgi:hypothetical protein